MFHYRPDSASISIYYQQINIITPHCRKVMHSLPEEVRDRIFAGRCGPSFLRNVTKAVKAEFKSVWFDHKLSLEEKESALKKLAYTLLSGETVGSYFLRAI